MCLPLLLVGLPACQGYRVVRPGDIQVPSYEARAVAIPAECDALVQQAAAGVTTLSEAQSRSVEFCQNQHLLRAQEEEAASRKLEAHAQAASFALQLTTVVVGATVAILAWVF